MHPAYGACVHPVWPIPLVGMHSKLKVENRFAHPESTCWSYPVSMDGVGLR